MAMRQPSPRTIAKATRLVIFARDDGSYDVAGDSGTYHVCEVTSASGRELSCPCPAGRSGSRCSHQLAIAFYEKSNPRA